MIYLYVKTHSITGLKYLGKATKDPYTYTGSGVDWKQHLKEHGKEHTTYILRECANNAELSEWGRYYSKLWNVAESREWANRIPETGGGSNHTEERKQLFRQQQLGKKKPPRTKEHTEKIAEQFKGKPNPKTSEGLRKWYSTNPDRSKIIEKVSESLKVWYQTNPEASHKKSIKRWDTIYQREKERYITAIQMAQAGKTSKEIFNATKFDNATIRKLRLKTHRIFEILPELKELVGT